MSYHCYVHFWQSPTHSCPKCAADREYVYSSSGSSDSLVGIIGTALAAKDAEIATLKAENKRMRGLLKSSYGYVKAHEHEGLTKGILAEIEQALNEKEK